MWLHKLRHTLSALATFLTRSLAHVAYVAYSMTLQSVRFGFGPRPPLADEEAVREPLMSHQESRLPSEPQPNHDQVMHDAAPSRLRNDDEETRDVANPEAAWDPFQDDDPLLAAGSAQTSHDSHALADSGKDTSARVPVDPRFKLAQLWNADRGTASQMPQTGEQRAESGRFSGVRFLPLIP